MASLQARHTRSCALGRPWTTFEDADEGCTCKPGPAYYVVTRSNGKLVREKVGRTRKVAERRLRAIQVEIDEDTYEAPSSMKFGEWADEWLGQLDRRGSTKAVYGISLDYAKATFGSKPVRKLTTTDIRAFLDRIRAENEKRGTKEKPREVSPTTLAKHLRQLGACLEAARGEGGPLRSRPNPVRLLHASFRPKAVKKEPSYFTDPELIRLWPELVEQPTLMALCKTAVTTGMRFGELAALRWPNVRLLEGEVYVVATYTPGVGETPTKDSEPRLVDLTPQARHILETWLAASGGEDGGLVFERETGGYLDGGRVLNALYAAMARAGIPRESERGGKRTFHSFRNTFARVALESGAEIAWVQGQLGHSSITLTVDTYGAWARQAQKAAAQRLEHAFAV